MAPELYKNSYYDPFCSDIFALGAILFKLITGEQMLEKEYGPLNPLYKPLLNGSPSGFWKIIQKRCPIVKTISVQLRLLLAGMINPDPLKRLTLGRIKSNSWLKGTTISIEDFILWMSRLPQKDESSDAINPDADVSEYYAFGGIKKLFSQLIFSILS